MRSVALCAIPLALASACGVSGGHPPVARFTIEPEFVPIHDGRRTTVELDGTRSADDFDDPASPLAFRWTLDDAFEVVTGATGAPVLSVRVGGERVVEVTLHVTDEDGDSASLARRIGLSLDR